MTNIAIFGSGRVASALAHKLGAQGHGITIGTRDPVAARLRWQGTPVVFASHAQAAAQAEIIFNATPGDSSLACLAAVEDELASKILIDVANATRRADDGLPSGLLYPDGSLGEALQTALPRTRVVKTLNTMLFTVMTDPASLSTAPTAFLSGEDDDAKTAVRGLLGDLGWEAPWIEDLGGIASARGTEAFVLMVPFVLKKRGFAPFALAVAR